MHYSTVGLSWLKRKLPFMATLFLVALARPLSAQESEPITFMLNDSVQFKMIAIKGGSFKMGSNASGPKSNQQPVYTVTLSDYFMGETEVTQELWATVMKHNPSSFRGKNLPVDTITWEEAHQFLERLNSLLHANGSIPQEKNFHLPSEAQWEFAARGGNKSQGFLYAGSNDINAVAWTKENAHDQTHPVAGKQPNELGLYDMSGNVWEWVEDYYAAYEDKDQTDPLMQKNSSNRVIKRGGSWYYAPEYYFQTAFRYAYYTSVSDSSIGLRLCLSSAEL